MSLIIQYINWHVSKMLLYKMKTTNIFACLSTYNSTYVFATFSNIKFKLNIVNHIWGKIKKDGGTTICKYNNTDYKKHKISRNETNPCEIIRNVIMHTVNVVSHLNTIHLHHVFHSEPTTPNVIVRAEKLLFI